MSLINTENTVSGRGPDIIVSFTFDEKRGRGRPSWDQLRELGQPQGRPRQLLADRYAYLNDGARA